MISGELERSISTYVYNQFLQSEEDNFLNFYEKYKMEFSLLFKMDCCAKCSRMTDTLPILMNIKYKGDNKYILLHEECLDEIVYSCWGGDDDFGLLKDFSITTVPI